jgi:FixJ family two-component response regulator
LDERLGFRKKQRFSDEVMDFIVERLIANCTNKQTARELEKMGVKMHHTNIGKMLKRTPLSK